MFAERLLTICLLMILLYFAFTPAAYAYLDPGTGSYIFQILIATIVGVGFLVKVYWGKIKGLFSRRSSEDVAASRSTISQALMRRSARSSPRYAANPSRALSGLCT